MLCIGANDHATHVVNWRDMNEVAKVVYRNHGSQVLETVQKMDVKGPNKTRQGPQITLNSEYKTCLGLKIVGYRSIINLIKPKIIICLPLLLM